MMAIIAISLRRVIRPQLIALFAAVVIVGIVGIGYLFNALIP